MKVLLDRADAALKLRLAKLRKEGEVGRVETTGMEGLVDNLNTTHLADNPSMNKKAYKEGVAAAGGAGGDEWEVLEGAGQGEGMGEEEVAIRVDQYLVVFVKFLSTMTPSIEHDYTMGI